MEAVVTVHALLSASHVHALQLKWAYILPIRFTCPILLNFFDIQVVLTSRLPFEPAIRFSIPINVDYQGPWLKRSRLEPINSSRADSKRILPRTPTPSTTKACWRAIHSHLKFVDAFPCLLRKYVEYFSGHLRSRKTRCSRHMTHLMNVRPTFAPLQLGR